MIAVHARTHVHVCACMHVCVCKERERERVAFVFGTFAKREGSIYGSNYAPPDGLLSRHACAGLVQQHCLERRPHDLPAVPAGRGAIRVQQAAALQVHRSHGAPLLEPGAQPPHPRRHAVQPSQVRALPHE